METDLQLDITDVRKAVDIFYHQQYVNYANDIPIIHFSYQYDKTFVDNQCQLMSKQGMCRSYFVDINNHYTLVPYTHVYSIQTLKTGTESV